MIGLKRKIAENLTISVGGMLLQGVLAIASVAFTARALGVGGFGEYNLVITILYIFSVFGSFGLDPLLIREIAKEGTDEPETIGRIFFGRFVLLCGFLLVGVVVGFLSPYSPAVKWGIFAAALGSLFFSLAQLLAGVFQKYLKNVVPAVAGIAARLAQLALSFYLYLHGADIFAFLFVFVLGGATNFIIVYWWVVVRIGIRFRVSMKDFLSVVREGWPLGVSAILTLIYFRGDTVILSLFHSSRDVGIYSVAYKVLENAIFIPIAFSGLVMPLLSRSAFRDPERFRTVFQKAFDFLALVALPFCAGGAYLSSDIVRILAGPGFEAAAAPLRLLFLAIVFIFFSALFGNTLIAIAKQKAALWAYGAAAAFSVAANLYFIPRYSYIGAAAVTAATEALVTCAMLFLILGATRLSLSLGVLRKACVASLVMLLALYIFPVHNAAALVAWGALVYLGLMIAFGGILKEDLLILLKA